VSSKSIEYIFGRLDQPFFLSEKFWNFFSQIEFFLWKTALSYFVNSQIEFFKKKITAPNTQFKYEDSVYKHVNYWVLLDKVH